MSAVRNILLATLFVCTGSAATLAQVPKEVLGSWSGDPNCSRIAMRHVFGETTFEWTGDGKRFYLGDATYALEGGRLLVTLTRDIDTPFKHPEAPRPSDILAYQRISDGWRPYSLTRDGKTSLTPSDTLVFRRCN